MKPKTLLEVMTESPKKTPRSRNANRSARTKGSKAESLLLQQLTELGYEVRRTHLSAFPDIVAWNETSFLLIEVKARNSAQRSINDALYMFRKSAKLLKVVHNSAVLLCYLRINGAWKAFEWDGSGTKEAEPLKLRER